MAAALAHRPPRDPNKETDTEREKRRDERRQRDGVHHGVRGEPDPAADGGPGAAGREAAGVHLPDEGAVRTHQGGVEPAPPPLRLLDLRPLQLPALLGPPDQPGPRPPRPLRRSPPAPLFPSLLLLNHLRYLPACLPRLPS